MQIPKRTGQIMMRTKGLIPVTHPDNNVFTEAADRKKE
jgi:hypothetical protein